MGSIFIMARSCSDSSVMCSGSVAPSTPAPPTTIFSPLFPFHPLLSPAFVFPFLIRPPPVFPPSPALLVPHIFPTFPPPPALPQSCVKGQISSRLFERCKYYRKRSLARRVMKVESFASVVPLWPTGHCTLLGSISTLAHLPAEKEGAQKSAPERAHERSTISLLLFSLKNETS